MTAVAIQDVVARRSSLDTEDGAFTFVVLFSEMISCALLLGQLDRLHRCLTRVEAEIPPIGVERAIKHLKIGHPYAGSQLTNLFTNASYSGCKRCGTRVARPSASFTGFDTIWI